MRTAQQILADLRHTTEWSQPNVRYNEFITLIDELEAVLANVKTTIEKAEKPAKVETVVETVETVAEVTEKVKEKATTAKK
jgi:ppGpp synthetase/RelA/SpoT-type nucleotidyltranferase